MNDTPCRVKIVGATGYSGGELISILLRHPMVEITAITASSVTKPTPIEQFWPALRGEVSVPVTKEMPGEGEADVVFTCVPHGAAMAIVPEYIHRGFMVIDLSADYRFTNPEDRAGWYSDPHTSPELCAQAVYGMPELGRNAIRTAQLIANPGCYPTGSILALYPGIRDGLIAPTGIHISAASGVTGAGKKPKNHLHHPELDQNFMAYRVGNHQHTPEIIGTLRRATEQPVSLSFVPHLLPLQRGILSTIFCQSTGASLSEIHEAYKAAYQNEPFIRIYNENENPTLHAVRGTNYLDLAFHQDTLTGEIILISAEDNLVKGAAGQAIQNLNIRMGYEETMGLIPPGTRTPSPVPSTIS